MNNSRSIWNENPIIYNTIKRVFAFSIAIIFPFTHYCVLTKSPKSFGILKWIIYFHCCCVTFEWLNNAFLIDIMNFQPTVLIRVDGFLNSLVDPATLYFMNFSVENVACTSALILFTSRLFKIFNMYRSHCSWQRYFSEGLVYSAVAGIGLWTIPTTVWGLPNQYTEKLSIVSSGKFYPDCLWDSTVVVTSGSDSESENFVSILIILNSISIGIVIFASAKAAFHFLAKRMEAQNASVTTRRMHQKFNERTIFQATLYLSFMCIPFIMIYITLLLNVRIQGLAYFIDFAFENRPVACIISFFLYYDPYRNYLLEVVRYKSRRRVINSSTAVAITSS
ncbi:Serpentine Receptor, class H [Caenorhabditis elegans]|uniref:Serpentine Receptor, class H n=1 Tax=Caenorhabditis elegans TaxID=6239 RepID=Q966I3_CAEEL|nr:Serpentine Receptor, class H [Caenorhabditis elegans]CCD62244.1 Serpentine Receptor, class H [Caenorhabditis elegans]|eukprot:NP_503205.1 Serpentine Receptor, class H [Caenorhabditis elegans]